MMKRRFISCWPIPVVLIIAFGMFQLIAYWFSGPDRLVHYRMTCRLNVQQIALALLVYSQDYDQKLPPAVISTKTIGWAEGTRPYIENSRIFQCPSEHHERQDNPDSPGFTDYWINRNAAGVKLQNFKDKAETILLGDGDGGSPESTASYTINQLPASWLQSSDSPAKRHLGGANYAFADGHVKWLKPEEISQSPTSQRAVVHTFSVK